MVSVAFVAENSITEVVVPTNKAEGSPVIVIADAVTWPAAPGFVPERTRTMPLIPVALAYGPPEPRLRLVDAPDVSPGEPTRDLRTRSKRP
jgi:hypothetical protein